MPGYIYLASPYTHPDVKVRVDRFKLARKHVIMCFQEKEPIFSPIVHWHHISMTENLPPDFEFYQVQNDAMLAAAKGVRVLGLPGWQDSRGVAHEMALAKALDKRVWVWHYNDALHLTKTECLS